MLNNIYNDYDKREEDLEFFLDDSLVLNWKGIKFKYKSKAYTVIKNMVHTNYETVFIIPNQQDFNTSDFKKHYDIIATNVYGNVVEVFDDVEPGTNAKDIDDCWFLYFFPAGSIKYFSIEKKHRIQFRRSKKRISKINLLF